VVRLVARCGSGRAGSVKGVSGVEDFEVMFGEFVRRALESEPAEEPHVPAWDQANLQLGLEALLERSARSSEIVGIGGGQKRYMSLSLSDLLNERHLRPGPPEYESVEIGPNASYRCLQFGLLLLTEPDARAVLLVRVAEQHSPAAAGFHVDVLASDPDRASALLDELQRSWRRETSSGVR